MPLRSLPHSGIFAALQKPLVLGQKRFPYLSDFDRDCFEYRHQHYFSKKTDKSGVNLGQAAHTNA
jgi:hypothetical protein